MLARARDAIEEAVKEASALPASERRRKLNALRLKWHPDKHAVLGEMAALFSDSVFHIGADETFVKDGDDCDLNSTAELEKVVVDAVASDFKKTPAGWEQVRHPIKLSSSFPDTTIN